MAKRTRRPEGSIREYALADGSVRFQVRVTLPGRDPQTGKFLRRSRSYADIETARRELRKWLAAFDAGQIVDDPERLTVEQLLRRWLDEDAAPRVRATTLATYRGEIERHLLPRIGTKRAMRLTPADVSALVAAIRRDAGTRSAQLALARLKQALGWAVAVELLPRNVAAGVAPPAGKATERRALTHAEARAFLDAGKDDPYSPLWTLYLATGLRRGEALALRWADVDFERGRLSVRRTLVKTTDAAGKRALVFGEPKSLASRRTLSLDRETLAALESHRKGRVSDALVFCTGHGTPLGPDNVYHRCRELGAAAKLGTVTVHMLRHTHATHLLLAGVPLELVARRLGHGSSTITLDTYSHALPGYDGVVLDAVLDALFPGEIGAQAVHSWHRSWHDAEALASSLDE